MAIDKPAAIAALNQLLDCCKSAETVVEYAGRSYTAKFAPVDFRDAEIKARSRQAQYEQPLKRALRALDASGFTIPKITEPQGPTTLTWAAQGENAWRTIRFLVPIIQVNHDPTAPFTIWESWPALEAIHLLAKKLRETIGQLEQKTKMVVDTKVDKKKLSTRGLTKPARWCAKTYKANRAKGDKTSMKAVILEYLDDNTGKFSSIMRSLSAHPEAWKGNTKLDKAKDKAI